MRESAKTLSTGCLVTSLTLLVFISPPGAAQDRYTDLLRGESSDLPNTVEEEAAPVAIDAGALTFFNDPTLFAANCSSLTREDFEDTSAPGGDAISCSMVINSATNDSCYIPNALVDGFSLRSVVGGLVILTPPAYGVSSVVAGPNSFFDDSEISFSGNNVTGVGVDLLVGVGLFQGPVDIEIFGLSDELLGTFTAALTWPPGQFFGVRSEQPISRIAFSNGYGELFDNLEFGTCAITVDIDILPSDPGNNLNLRAGSGSTIGVALVSDGEFDSPSLVDPSTLRFGPRGATISGSANTRDVNGDGRGDLLVKFPTADTGIACGDSHASLSGFTFDGERIWGSDAINTFNCPRIRKRW